MRRIREQCTPIGAGLGAGEVGGGKREGRVVGELGCSWGRATGEAKCRGGGRGADRRLDVRAGTLEASSSPHAPWSGPSKGIDENRIFETARGRTAFG